MFAPHNLSARINEHTRLPDSQSNASPHKSNISVSYELWDDIICHGDDDPRYSQKKRQKDSVETKRNCSAPPIVPMRGSQKRLSASRGGSRFGRAVTAGALMKAQKIRLFRNGDPFFKGTIFVVSADR